ncbi:MAG: hypothetical protein GYB65_13080 [Chloroflexi bacterium]|nr:hypothetical protein [Chloroflexota bacterium]
MQLETVSAVVMVGPGGTTPPEHLVYHAIQAAVLDLLDVLYAQGIQPVIVAGPDLDWLDGVPNIICDVDAVENGGFHFGQRLAGLIETYSLSPVIYFGAGSAPLLNQDMIGLMHGMLYQSAYGRESKIPPNIALTNNLHSSDWIGISHVQEALPIIRQAERDNSLAWMLQENWDFDVRVLSGVRPASSMDLDTPSDLAIVRHHPECPPHLREALQHPLLDRVPVNDIIDVAARDGSRVALVGRVSPLAWQALSKATQCWIRCYSEERGMVASERLNRGEVDSLLGRMLALLGPEAFFAELASLADAVIMDSRVLMAATGRYPSAAERFAADLYLMDDLHDPWLRTFTQAAADAPIPVLLGGHGVVSGGLYALADVIALRRKGAGKQGS